MIFDNNSTSLSVSQIPMDESYDKPYGAALALVEGARNDFAMFKAMLGVDARELQIRNESANGYVTEGELISLQEGALASIWNKIVEFFKKLIAKIKAIFHNFIAKFDSLTKSDKQLVKKYQNEVLRKSNIGNLEVKWRKITQEPGPIIDKFLKYNGDYLYKTMDISTPENLKQIAAQYSQNWKEDRTDRQNVFVKSLGINGADIDTLATDYEEACLDAEDTYQIKDSEIGGIRNVIQLLEGADKKSKDAKKVCDNAIRFSDKLISAANKNADNAAKESASKDNNQTTEAKDAAVKVANHAYDMSVDFQSVLMIVTSTYLNILKTEYKYAKAAFMKAVAADNEKLAEQAVYLDAVEEAAAEEVEDVIDGAMDTVDLSNTNNASTNVLDADVDNSPEHMEAEHDRPYKPVSTDGTEDTKYTREAAYFGAPLY